jgi:cytochrome P450
MARSSTELNAVTVGAPVWDEKLRGWSVTRYEDCLAVLRDPERFTSEGGAIAENLGAQAMLVIDSALHDRVREIWRPSFGSGALSARLPALSKLALDTLAPVAARLASGSVVDVVPALERFAEAVVLDLMDFVQPASDVFRGWYKTILAVAAFNLPKDDPREIARHSAKAQVYAFLSAEIEDRHRRQARSESPQDLVALMAFAERSKGLSRVTVLDNIFNIFLGGADTTVRWIGNALVTLHNHPDELAALRADPRLIPLALEETMRLETVTRFAVRTARADDACVADVKVPRGDTVYLRPGDANRDPAVFAEPDRFDIRRKDRRHLGFGHGLHKCIGMNLARLEARVFIETLLTLAPRTSVAAVDYGDDSVVRGPQSLHLRAGDGLVS